MRPFKAAFKFANVPVTVIEDEPLEPELKVSPVVDPRVSLPYVTDSVSESDAPEAAASVTLIVPEKVSELFSFTPAAVGAVMLGGGKLLTVIATVADPVRLSPESLTEICSESEPR